MSTIHPDDAISPVPTPAVAIATGAGTILAVVLGLFAPDATAGGDSGMVMTHYMGLLSANQPWNLLLFMAAPVVLAETLAITELVILFRRGAAPVWVERLSRVAGLVAGPLMLGITIHLLRHAVLPLSLNGGWFGAADVIAVGFYLLGVVPLVGITLVELGLIGRTVRDARKWHAIFVGVFLIVAHIAMIAGMLDPTVLGWSPSHMMTDGSPMPGMTHDH